MEKKKIPDALQPGEKIIDIEDAEEVADYMEEAIENGDITPEEWHDYYGRMQDWIYRNTCACIDELEAQADNFFTMTKAQLKEEAARVYIDGEPDRTVRGMFIDAVASNIRNFRKPFDKKTGAEELKTLLPTIRALLTGEDFGNSISADCLTMFKVDPDHPKDHPPLWWFIVDEARVYYADQKEDEAERHEITPDKPKAPPRLPISRIKTYSMMNDKLNKEVVSKNGIFEQTPDGQMRISWGYDAAAAGSKAEIGTIVSLLYDGDESVKVKRQSAFNEAVHNAVNTLWYFNEQKNPGTELVVTAEELWRVMNGKQAGDTSVKVTAKQLQKVRASMDFQRATLCTINLAEQIKAHLITLDDERLIDGVMSDNLISAFYGSFTTETGRVVEGYAIKRPPILYTYNQARKTLLYLDFDLLDTTGEINNSENVIEFRSYLLREIKVMRMHAWTNDYSTRIKLATLYEKTGIKPPEDRKEAKKNRDKIEGLLTAWMKKGFIESFLPVKEGKAHNVIGYDIILPNPAKIEEAHKPGRIEKKKKK